METSTHTAQPVTIRAAPRDNTSRLRELDSLRGIAASLVFLFHITYYDDTLHRSPIAIWWGHYGVELFFVISGFVILMTMERSGRVLDFAISRVARLYPAYWCAICVTSAAAIIYRQSPIPTIPQLLSNATMLQGFMHVSAIDPSYWTLSLELVFYCMIVLWFRYRCAQCWRIEWYALGWIATVSAIRALLIIKHASRIPGILATALLCYYGQFFIIGMCLYRIYRGESSYITFITMAAACAMSLFGGGPSSLYPGSIAYFLVTCAVTVAVWIALAVRPRVLRHAVLLFLGDISYPLYLLHQRFGSDLMKVANAEGYPAWLSMPVTAFLVVCIAWVIHLEIEVPGRSFLRARLRLLFGANVVSEK